MSTPRWPADLPAPLLAEYGEGVVPSVLVFEPDVGPAITRRRGTVTRRVLSVTYRMTDDTVQTFEDFFFNEIASGTLSFRMTHPRLKTDRLFKMVLRQGEEAYSLTPRTPLVYDVKLRIMDVGP